MKHLFYIAIVFSLGFYSCKNKKATAENTTIKNTEERMQAEGNTIKAKPSVSTAIADKHWRAIELMGEKVIIAEEMKNDVYFILNNEGNMNGNGGCNSFFGNYELKGKNFISIKTAGMTEMACTFNNYDQKLTEVLKSAQQFIMVGENKMQLIIGKRAPLGIFEAVQFE